MSFWKICKRLFALSSAALILSCAMTASNHAQQSETAPAPVARVIVKLHSATDQEALMQLIRQKLPHPERLIYLHPMSGDAHVLSVVAPASSESVAMLLDELRATNLFEYVELDRMMTIHGPPKDRKPSK